MDFKRPASEFPNDNLDLHDGALWRCRSLIGPARAIARPRAAEQKTRDFVSELPRAHPVEVAPPTLTSAQPFPHAMAELASVQPFPEAVAELASVQPIPQGIAALHVAESATPLVGPAAAPGLAKTQPETAAQPIVRTPSPAFENLLRTLADVLLTRGATRAASVVGDLMRCGSVKTELMPKPGSESDDRSRYFVVRGGTTELSSDTHRLAQAWRAALEGDGDLTHIGHSTLDGFCSELLAALCADTSATAPIRRELRSRGVAAFGLLEVAA